MGAAAARAVTAVENRLQAALAEPPGAEEVEVEVHGVGGVRQDEDELVDKQVDGVFFRPSRVRPVGGYGVEESVGRD